MSDNKVVFNTFEEYLQSIGIGPAVEEAAGPSTDQVPEPEVIASVEEPVLDDIKQEEPAVEQAEIVTETETETAEEPVIEPVVETTDEPIIEQVEETIDEHVNEPVEADTIVETAETVEEPAAENAIEEEPAQPNRFVEEPENEQEPETEPEIAQEESSEAEPEPIADEPTAESEQEPVVDQEPESLPEEEPIPESEQEPEAKPEHEAEPVAESKPEEEPTPESEPEAEPMAVTESEEKSVEPEEEPEEEEEEEPRGGCFKVFVLFLLLFMIAAGSFVALDRFVVHGNKFLPGTTINGVDVGEMNTRQASKALETDWASHTLNITMNGETVDTLSELDLAYNADQKVEDTLHAGWVECIKRLLSKRARKLTIELQPDASNSTFDTAFESLNIVKNHKVAVESKDAYIDLSNTDFNVVDEVYGDSLDKEKLKTALINAIAVGQEEFKYSPSKFYLEPKIKYNSKEIEEQLKYCETYLSHTIKYKGFKGMIDDLVITPAQVNKFISVADDGTVKVNKSRVQTFVEDTICKQFTTEGIERKIKSKATGKKFTVTGGDYGLTVSVEQEVKQLTKDLKSMKNVERMPKYTTEINENQKDDIGDTYVEVDLTNQVLYYVENGKVEVECYVVTGTEATGHGTPQGVYAIRYMATHVTLKGRNDDGTKYESKVTYWMPFNLPYEIGLHDATWRGAFGGGIYYYSGSHGCVNMPFNAAQALFGRVEVGTIVICHY